MVQLAQDKDFDQIVRLINEDDEKMSWQNIYEQSMIWEQSKFEQSILYILLHPENNWLHCTNFFLNMILIVWIPVVLKFQ